MKSEEPVTPEASFREQNAVSTPVGTFQDMCRNITPLRGLQPAATAEEIEAAARQYVRKVASQPSPSVMADAAFELAVRRVAEATTDLLASLPERRTPPKVDPPLRRLPAGSTLG